MRTVEAFLSFLFPPKLPTHAPVDISEEVEEQGMIVAVYPKRYRDGIDRVMQEQA